MNNSGDIDEIIVPDTLRVVVDCILDKPISKETFSQLDTSEFLEIAESHRVISAIGRHANTLPDSELKCQILEQYHENKLNQLYLVKELINLATWFNEINFVVFKGPILSQRLYDDPAERTSWDLDVLIDLKDYDFCVETLKKQGYEPVMFFNTPKQKEAIQKHFHHLDMYNHENGILIELHWNLTAIKEHSITINDVIPHCEVVNLNQVEFKTLNFEQLLEYLSIHGVFHSFYRMQWLEDLRGLLLQKSSDELAALYNQVLHNKTGLYVLTAFNLLHHYFDFSFPEEIRKSIHQNGRVYDLTRLAREEIDRNTHGIQKSRIKTMIHNHKVQYYTGGFSALIKSIFARNVRPENWKIFAFPDSVFFLNHIFSRLIWIYGKILGKL